MVARDTLGAERNMLTAERDTLRAARAALSAALDAIHESTIWRVTAPMRAIIDMFRRLKSRHDI